MQTLRAGNVDDRLPFKMQADYSGVTELPGSHASNEQLSIFYHRYRSVAPYCDDKDVLEVGCGAGQGLGYLATRARKVVGGDYTQANLSYAHRYYRDRIKLVRLDAHHLPFPDSAFDVVILLEALYYLARPEEFLEESHRVLRTRGVLFIGTVNKEWSDFHPSSFSVRYFSASELDAMLRRKQFEVELFGAYPASNGSAREKTISVIKRTASALHLIPRTMRQKEILKRIFFGKLVTLAPEIKEGAAKYDRPIRISGDSANPGYKVIYAVARAQ